MTACETCEQSGTPDYCSACMILQIALVAGILLVMLFIFKAVT